MTSINPYAEGKEHILFVYDTPMAFQIHFCLTITTHSPIKPTPHPSCQLVNLLTR